MFHCRLTGKISSIVPVSETKVLFSADLPLESLCKPQDTFVLPDLLNSNGPIRDKHTDDEIIRPEGKEASVTDTLFNLPRNPNVRVRGCHVCYKSAGSHKHRSQISHDNKYDPGKQMTWFLSRVVTACIVKSTCAIFEQ